MKLIYVVKQNIASWIAQNKNGLIITVLTFIGLQVLSFLPYVNLLLNKYLIFTISFIASVFFIKIRLYWLVLTSFILFIITAIIWMLGRFEDAENLGNVIYVILLMATLSGMINFPKKEDED